MPFGIRKKDILEDLFSSVSSPIKKYHPLETKFNYFPKLKIAYFIGKKSF